MKYRTKLHLLFLSIAGCSALLAGGIGIIKARSYLFRELQSKATSIAATTASQIDGDELKEVNRLDGETAPAYPKIKEILRRAKVANQRKYTDVAHVFIIFPDPDHPNVFLYGVGTDPVKNGLPHFGIIDEQVSHEEFIDHRTEPYAYGKLRTDEWGDWLNAYAPVFDSQGQYVGSVGVNVSATFIQQHLDVLLERGLLAVLISMVFALILSSWISKRVTRNLAVLQSATVEIGSGHLNYRVNLHSNDEFQDLATSMNSMSKGLEERERLKLGFARYVSQYVLEKILSSEGGALKLEGERRKVTVLFSDIKNFTHFAETMQPEKLFAFLNEYFSSMLGIIFKYNGMLDKIIGDGIMAEFGAPLDDPQQERNAVLAAIDMQKELITLRAKWATEAKPVVQVGIGIHTGQAVVGTLGSEQRMEYTAIGDTVNTASRLEAMTREVDYCIIISETTHSAVQNAFSFVDLGPKTLKGKDTPIRTYAIKIV